MARRLEEFNFFPLIAWTVVLGFAAFTFSLSMRLHRTDAPIESHRAATIEQLRTTP